MSNRNINDWSWRRSARTAAFCLALACATVRTDATESLETWEGGGVAGWTNDTPDATLANPGGYLDVTFKVQGIPMPSDVRVWVQVPNGVLLTNLTFQFRAAPFCPSAVRVVLQSANGHLWHRTLVCAEAGIWQTLNVPVAYSEAWSMGPLGGPVVFERDLRHIVRMGVYVRRHGAPAEQHYGLDDFTLQGLALSALDLDGDGMRDAWELAHQLNPDDPTDAASDADGDGMRNYGEYVAGTDPQDPESRFVVDVEVISPAAELPGEGGAPVEGVVLHWNSVSNRTYAIWHTLDLKAGSLEALDSGVPATPPLNEFADPSSTNRAVGYYFIDVQSTE